VTIPGPGHQTGRTASWTPVPDDIVCAPSQLRFCPAKRNGRIRGGSGSPGPAADSLAFGAAANGFHNPQVEKPIMKPIILQVPNRDTNSAKMIRPVQGPFSGLQNAPDSDRFTLLIRRFWVRIPGGAPGQRRFPELRPEGISHEYPIDRFNGTCEIPVHAFHCGSGSWLTLSGRGSGTWATVAPVPA
jgi:hypothetical protein